MIQKLISVLPSAELGPLHAVILANMTRLATDRVGCRVVQFMMEFCNPQQQREMTGLVCDPGSLVTIACDAHGTYVAQVGKNFITAQILLKHRI